MENLNLLCDLAPAAKFIDKANPESNIQAMGALGLELKPQVTFNCESNHDEPSNNVSQEQIEPLDLSLKSYSTRYEESIDDIKTDKSKNSPARSNSLYHSQLNDQNSVYENQASLQKYMADNLVILSTFLFNTFPEIKPDGQCKYDRKEFCPPLETSNNLHRKHVCTNCGDAFLTEFNLKKHHAKAHAAPKLHVCVHCKKSFVTQGSLKSHIASVHAEKKKYQCTQCGRSFSQNSNLQRHFNSLHGEKPFKCDFPTCKGAFSEKTSLEDHICSQHLKISKYRCEICSKAYVRSSSLARHERTIHGHKNCNAEMS